MGIVFPNNGIKNQELVNDVFLRNDRKPDTPRETSLLISIRLSAFEKYMIKKSTSILFAFACVQALFAVEPVVVAPWSPSPAPADAPEKPENVRIVKLGIEHQRSQDGQAQNINSYHRYKLLWDEDARRYKIFRAPDDLLRAQDLDVDGDGETKDDLVIYHKFDLSPDNPLTPYGPFFDMSAGSQRFYGGLAVQIADAEEKCTGFTEDGMNGTEEGVGFQPRRNWTFFREDFNPYSPFRIHGVFLWLKHDFLNGGADHKVSFDDQSELRHLVMRYFLGIEAQRWVVRNGEKLYISESIYRGAGESGGGIIHVCHPTKTKWAEYNPEGYKIAFDPKTAVFENRRFDDVTAVGWYIAKDTLSPSLFGSKWYAFEADAVVHRKARPSESIAMKPLASDAKTYLATVATPYTLWRQVHRLARYNGFAGPRGFVFRSYGDMGPMAFPDPDGKYGKHNGDEPVTNLTYADALAWCNALSQQESKTPCYYTDADFKTPLREVAWNPMIPADRQKLPTVFVKWDADGYRLPTPAEWAAGNLKSEISNLKTPSVREMVWDFGDSVNLETLPQFTALGDDFRKVSDPASSSASAYGDKPFFGSPFIGFRVLRREPGQPKPDMTPAKSVPSWTVKRDLLTAPDPKRQLAKPLKEPWLEMKEVKGTPWGKYEVTYAKWKPVYDWAVANGYSFDTTGGMGSMAYWGFGKDWKPGEHGPDEPVTGVTYYEVCTWLNALSEIEGKTPVYHTGKQLGEPLRKTPLFRPLQRLRGEVEDVGGVGKVFPAASSTQVYTLDPKANGYRLPALKEFTALIGGGKGKNEDNGAWLELGWFADNSGFRTHPAGKKGEDANGLYDLLGNVSELADPYFDLKLFTKGGGAAYAMRLGGGFFDSPDNLLSGYTSAEPAMNHMGFGYPDTGFRPVLQK